MLKQKDLIREKNWDCLIVLDSCRFDFFEEVFQNFLAGSLRKVFSPGSHTFEWFKETFEDEGFADIVYVSANPNINSSGGEVEEVDTGDCFYKVIDVWDWGWSDKIKAIPPESVGKATRLARARYPDKPLISHFMQPHCPYLSLSSSARVPLEGGDWQGAIQTAGEKVKKSLAGIVGSVIEGMVKNFRGDLEGHRVRIKAMDMLNLIPPRPEELVARKHGDEGLRKAYKKNLKIALTEVVKVVGRLPGRVCITADHGELLGEDGQYGHPFWSDNPVQREVPWFEVE